MNENKTAFPFTKTETLALEYAKLKATNETTPEEFALTYQDAYNRIREALSHTSSWKI